MILSMVGPMRIAHRRAPWLIMGSLIAACAPSRSPATGPATITPAMAPAATDTPGTTETPASEAFARPRRPVYTFSIVARDASTGELGVAVQSHWFSVGSVVTWAEAGVGAVATQSFAEPAYGPRGLALMRSGLPAPQALSALISADPAQGVRQIAFVDASGNIAVHTGAQCIEHAGHKQGKGYSVQANMMLNDKVVPAMAKAYETTRGDLAERLMAALEAGQAAGGDIRGKQSAAMLIVKGRASGKPWQDRVLELRIEDHAAPVTEMRRLLTMHRAYEHMNAGDVAIEQGRMKDALQHYRSASKLVPDNLEMKYWHAVALATNGRVKQSIPLFREVFAKDSSWVELTRRLHKPGIFSDTPQGRALVEQIVREAR
jgi:uncharacterized Ntn-hydrolase superfamily protein